MRNSRIGFFSLLVVGGYYLWRNRFRVQQYLESVGIDMPLSTRNVGDTIRSGVAKVSGNLEHASKHIDRDLKKAV